MQLTYFPYLNMKDTAEAVLKELDVKVWNYSKKADEYVPDTELRKTLDGLMATNITHWKTIGDMGIVTLGECDWREYTSDEVAICQEARLLLFIGCLGYSGILERGANTGWNMSTSENFTMVRQNFQKGGDRMGTEDGYIVRKWAGGYKIAEVKFMQPEYTPEPQRFTGDDDILRSLMRLRKRSKRIYRRLMRAVDVFMQAYYNDTKLSEQARILLIASAYEILFDLPDNNQRKALKDTFTKYFVEPTDIKRRYKSQRTPTNSVWETDSIKVMWADKFYTLRNKIIHGGVVKPADYAFCDKQMHFEIATLFFVLGLKKVMGETPYVSETVDEVTWKKPEKPEDPDDDYYIGFVYEDNDKWAGIVWQMRRNGKNAKN